MVFNQKVQEANPGAKGELAGMVRLGVLVRDLQGFTCVLRAEHRFRCVFLQATAQRADSRLVGGFEVALGWLWGGFGVALGWLWGGFEVALGWLWGGFEVALRWLWGGFVRRSLCLVYGFGVALGWLWGGFRVALGWLWVALLGTSAFFILPSSFCLLPSSRSLLIVRMAYITRPDGGWHGPKSSPRSLPCMPGDSPMTLPCVSPAPIIGSAYATASPEACSQSRRFGSPPPGPSLPVSATGNPAGFSSRTSNVQR